MNLTYLWQIKATEVKNDACPFVEQCQKGAHVFNKLKVCSLWSLGLFEFMKVIALGSPSKSLTYSSARWYYRNLEHQRWCKIKSSRKIRKNMACVAMQGVCVGVGNWGGHYTGSYWILLLVKDTNNTEKISKQVIESFPHIKLEY